MWRWITAAVLGVALGALIVIGLSPPPSFVGHPPPAPVPGIDDAQRVEAMLTIHAHARSALDPDFPLDPFLPLPEAVPILRRDVGPAADSRRRRAIAKLAAYGFDRPEFREAIDGLGGDVDFIEARFPDLPLPPLERYIVLVNLLAYMTPLCEWQAHHIEVIPGSPLEWTLEILVPRRFYEIARALDPQSWAECLPTFEQSYFAKVEGPCCSADAEVGDCVPSAATDSGFPEVSTTRARGRPTRSRVFFEQVCLDEDDCEQCRGAPVCDLDFETLLCVETTYDIPTLFHHIAPLASRYDLGFLLVSPSFSENWGFGEVNGVEGYQLSTDSGYLCTEELPSGSAPCVADVTEEILDSLGPWNWSAVGSHKKVEFASSALQEAAAVLETAEDELRDQLGELACCRVEEEPWGPLWLEWILNIVGRLPSPFASGGG